MVAIGVAVAASLFLARWIPSTTIAVLAAAVPWSARDGVTGVPCDPADFSCDPMFADAPTAGGIDAYASFRSPARSW